MLLRELAPLDGGAESAASVQLASSDNRALDSPTDEGLPTTGRGAALAPIGPSMPSHVPAHRKRRPEGKASRGNARIHPSSCYAEAEPDFMALANEDPCFARHVRVGSDGRGHIDFRDRTATRCACAACLAGLTLLVSQMLLCRANHIALALMS